AMGAGRILGAGSGWAGALLVTLAMLRTHLAHCTEPPKRFVFQFKGDCHFTNGTERVRLLARWIYNQQQFVHFDSDLGLFVADTELGRSWAEGWNKDQAFLAQKRAEVDTYCRNNYRVDTPFTIDRRGEWDVAGGGARGVGRSAPPAPRYLQFPTCAGDKEGGAGPCSSCAGGGGQREQQARGQRWGHSAAGGEGAQALAGMR
uniref:MHC class II beta chain N-terminal domain-containing protein n=1 Tax=Terrapene triunguis TaxID=2587831 RepID=A0A674J0S1_9SAUR